jgi:hypothetical protein
MRMTLPEIPDSERGYWAAQAAGWGLLFLVQLFDARFANWPWERALVELAICTVLLVLATHVVRNYAHRQDWTAKGIKFVIGRCVAASIAIAVLVVAALAPWEIVFYGDRRLFSTWNGAMLAINLAVVLLVWHALYFSAVLLRQHRNAGAEEARLRAALRTAELSLLKSQLNPHFLFNALNTVRALIAESPDRAELAVTQLARTLRYSLNSSRDELVTLEHELGIVRDYLGIETLRLAERLTIVQHVDAEALRAEIPIMLLQTLVENAVKHGISQLPGGGTLRISAHMEGRILVIEVSNDRPLVKMGSIPSDRVGLANANERLRLMIGPSATLKLNLEHPERAVATVRIPQLEGS